MTFRLSGQIPSGKNAVVVTRTGLRFPAKRFKLWREEVMKQLSPQVSAYAQEVACLPLESTITLECEYTPGDARVRDVDGMLGALLHVIVKAGLLVDDGLVWAVTWKRNEMDRQKPGLRFTISQEALKTRPTSNPPCGTERGSAWRLNLKQACTGSARCVTTTMIY